jgi:hypothetical protein
MSKEIKNRLKPFVLILAILFGLFAAEAYTARSKRVAQSASHDSDFASTATARRAMDQIRHDMQRSGYVEVDPGSTKISLPAKRDQDWDLAQSDAHSLSFHSAKGEDVSYAFDGQNLTRSSGPSKSVLVAGARDFKIQPAPDGKSIHVAIWIPVGNEAPDTAAGQAPVYTIFVRAGE